MHKMHDDVQDESSEVWLRLLDLIEETAATRATTFAPGRVLQSYDWPTVSTLPTTIEKLTCVEKLDLYGSNLSRLPSEIGKMTSLVEFLPYTSLRLHWFPYELSRCRNLSKSLVSTRAVYGNRATNLSPPSLKRNAGNDRVLLRACTGLCSVCGERPVVTGQARWIQKDIATDQLMLLAFLCSKECLDKAAR